jgi:hypothetical protein
LRPAAGDFDNEALIKHSAFAPWCMLCGMG